MSPCYKLCYLDHTHRRNGQRPHTPLYSQQSSDRQQQDVQPKNKIEENRSDVDIIDETRTINGIFILKF